jgi:hypothetical protein
MVFSFRRCTDGNGFWFPARSAENGGNGFQFPSLYRPETFFSFRRVRQRTEETVFSFRKIFQKSRQVQDARKSASKRVHCCFCSSPGQANSAILVNLKPKDQRTHAKNLQTPQVNHISFFFTLIHIPVSFGVIFVLATALLLRRGVTNEFASFFWARA